MAKRLFRSANQKMLGGVCAGLAEYLDIDISIVRLLWVGLALVMAVLPIPCRTSPCPRCSEREL